MDSGGASDDDDLADEGDEYLNYLSSRAKGEGEDDDDDDFDDAWDAELEEDIYFESPLDSVDPYKTFATVLLGQCPGVSWDRSLFSTNTVVLSIADLSHRDQALYSTLTSSLSPAESQKLQEAITKGTTPTA